MIDQRLLHAGVMVEIKLALVGLIKPEGARVNPLAPGIDRGAWCFAGLAQGHFNKVIIAGGDKDRQVEIGQHHQRVLPFLGKAWIAEHITEAQQFGFVKQPFRCGHGFWIGPLCFRQIDNPLFDAAGKFFFERPRVTAAGDAAILGNPRKPFQIGGVVAWLLNNRLRILCDKVAVFALPKDHVIADNIADNRHNLPGATARNNDGAIAFDGPLLFCAQK